MTLYGFLKDVYSLDTLDTRLTTPSKTPAKGAHDVSKSTRATVNGSKVSAERPASTSPSKWGTIEFYMYTIVFVFCVPLMYKAVWDVSQPSSPHYQEYEN